MDAVLYAAITILFSGSPQATYRTQNFIVTAPTADFAKQVGDAAEFYRRELALAWTGRVMPPWSAECPIFVRVGQMGAGGSTTFNFEGGHVFGWNMKIQGSAERILDSVLPHEINHTIFASYFRQPLPRWADEGAASLIEHESERARLKRIHEQVLHKTNKIPLQQLLSMKNYPTEEQQVLVLYAEGYSLADFLVQLGDRPHYLKFLSAALHKGWDAAFQEFYGYDRLDRLEQDLERWVLAGSPDLPDQANVLLARQQRNAEPVIRAQSPDPKVQLGPPGPWPKRLAPPPPLTPPQPPIVARSRSQLTLPVITVAHESAAKPLASSRTRLQQP